MKRIREHLGLAFLIIIAIFAVVIGGYFKGFISGMIFITKSVQISLCTTHPTMWNAQKMTLFYLWQMEKSRAFPIP